MPESPPIQRKTEHGRGERSLYYSLLFQILKEQANVIELVVWNAQSKNGLPLFSCAADGLNPSSAYSEGRQKLIDRALTSGKTVISGKKTDNSKGALVKQFDIYRAVTDSEIAQIGFTPGKHQAEYETYIQQVERLIELDFMVGADSFPLNPRSFSDATAVKQTTECPAAEHPAAGQPSIGNPDQAVLNFFQNINQSLDLKSTAFQIANELRLITQSDRVSVFRFRSKHPKAVAVSGVSVVNRRSKEVRQLEELVKKTMRLGRVFVYPLDTQSELPSQIESTLSGYLTDQSTRSLMIVPVKEPKEETAKQTEVEAKRRRRKPSVIGAFAIEYFQSQIVESDVISRNEKFGLCAADAFRNAFLHHRLFLYPVWYWLGKAYEFFIGRHLSKTVIGASAIVLTVIAAMTIQSEYRLSCEGEIRPESYRTIYAEIDGLITEVMIDTGESVEAGKLLLKLENQELLIRHQELSGNREALNERIESIDRFSVGDPRNPDQNSDNANQLALERAGLRKQIETIDAQLAIVDRQIEMQVLHSPINGEVLTTNLRQELADRPVSRGAKLFDIAATEGQWVVDLKLPDRKLGEFLKAQEENVDRLSVVFVLSSDPEREHLGVIKSVELRTEADDEIGQFLRVLVDIQEDQLENLKIGTEVIAYIQCGNRSLGYIWTKEVVDFVRKRIIFPLW